MGTILTLAAGPGPYPEDRADLELIVEQDFLKVVDMLRPDTIRREGWPIFTHGYGSEKGFPTSVNPAHVQRLDPEPVYTVDVKRP